jgi:hypothetical protein
MSFGLSYGFKKFSTPGIMIPLGRIDDRRFDTIFELSQKIAKCFSMIEPALIIDAAYQKKYHTFIAGKAYVLKKEEYRSLQRDALLECLFPIDIYLVDKG